MGVWEWVSLNKAFFCLLTLLDEIVSTWLLVLFIWPFWYICLQVYECCEIFFWLLPFTKERVHAALFDLVAVRNKYVMCKLWLKSGRLYLKVWLFKLFQFQTRKVKYILQNTDLLRSHSTINLCKNKLFLYIWKIK